MNYLSGQNDQLAPVDGLLGDDTDLPGWPACYFEYEWDAASRITLIRRENRDSIYYGYDEADRLTSERWQAAQGGTIYAFQWDYDLVGNRVYESAAGVGDWLVFRRSKTCLSPSPLAGTACMTARGQAPALALTYYEHGPANELIRSRQIGVLEFSGHHTYLRATPPCYFEYEYDAACLSKVIGPENCVTEYAYDAYGRMTTVVDPEGYVAYFG